MVIAMSRCYTAGSEDVGEAVSQGTQVAPLEAKKGKATGSSLELSGQMQVH